MTLRDYTDFVVKFARSQHPSDAHLCGDLGTLFGGNVDLWHKFLKVFKKRARYKRGNLFIDKVKINEWLFLQTLAEFCEPLIERTATAEKPGGGQDAAKA